jgi:cation:H+ antiporter
MIASFGILLGSLALLVAGADVLVRGASSLAFRLRLAPLFVGLTIVAMGTSTPELASSITAALRDSPGIATGNVVGSNIFNIAVILGIAAVICPVRIHFAAVRRDLVVATVVCAVPWTTLLSGGRFTRPQGALAVLALFAYLYAAFRAARRATPEEAQLASGEIEAAAGASRRAGRHGALGTIFDVGLVLAGLALLVLGSRGFVSAAIDMARSLGVSELTIGLTIVAAGTSMPELLTSIVAAYRGQSDIAVGNVVGSNIFNILGVLGACSLLRPQQISDRLLWLDIPVMFVASLALLPVMKSGGCISRFEGALLLAGYVGYVCVLARLG